MADRTRIRELEKALRELRESSAQLLAELEAIAKMTDAGDRDRALLELLRTRLELVPKK